MQWHEMNGIVIRSNLSGKQYNANISMLNCYTDFICNSNKVLVSGIDRWVKIDYDVMCVVHIDEKDASVQTHVSKKFHGNDDSR